MTLSLTTSQVGGFSATFKCRSTVEIKALLAEHAELVPPNVSQTVLLQQLEYGKPRPTSSFNTKAKAYWAVFKTLDSGNIVASGFHFFHNGAAVTVPGLALRRAQRGTGERHWYSIWYFDRKDNAARGEGAAAAAVGGGRVQHVHVNDDGALHNVYTKRVPPLNSPCCCVRDHTRLTSQTLDLLSDDTVEGSVDMLLGPSLYSSASASSSSSTAIQVGKRAIRGIAKRSGGGRGTEQAKRSDEDEDVPFASARGTSPASAPSASSAEVSAATSAPAHSLSWSEDGRLLATRAKSPVNDATFSLAELSFAGDYSIPPPPLRASDAQRSGAGASADDGGGSFLCGDRVEARWGVLRGGRLYYPGHVTAVWADGAYNIKYDDGEQEKRVSGRYVRRVSSAASATATEGEATEEEPRKKRRKVGQNS